MKTKDRSGDDRTNGADGAALHAAPGSGEWLGACDWCGTKHAMGNGQAKMGRKFLRVLLFCDKCRTRTVHKFNLPNVDYKEQDSALTNKTQNKP